MDTKFQTSFIPKKTMEQGALRRGPSMSVFFLVSIIIFILALAAAGGVFWYKKILIGKINTMNRQLSEAKNSFDPNLIQTLNVFNKRIEAAKQVLGAHSVVSPVFDLLENDTLATVKFDSFSYELKNGGDNAMSMSGEAKTFSSVALQSDAFGQDKNIKNPVFSGLNPDKNGNILFKFDASVDTAYLSYKNSMATQQ